MSKPKSRLKKVIEFLFKTQKKEGVITPPQLFKDQNVDVNPLKDPKPITPGRDLQQWQQKNAKKILTSEVAKEAQDLSKDVLDIMKDPEKKRPE